MEAYSKNRKPTIQRGSKSAKIITVPGLSVDLRKIISSVMRNPVDTELNIYSSKNPDLLDPMDLKMMSKLDRLRLHADLREKNRFADKKVKSDILSTEKIIKKRRDEIKRQKDIQIQEQLKSKQNVQ